MKQIIFSIMFVLVLMPGLTLAVPVADMSIVSFNVRFAPVQATLGDPFNVLLEKVVTNNGPDGPHNGWLVISATAPSGPSVIPLMETEFVEDLAVLEQRTILESFSLTLSDVGLQTFTFTKELSVLDAEDPDLTNNTARLTLDIVGVTEPSVLALLGFVFAAMGYARKRKQTYDLVGIALQTPVIVLGFLLYIRMSLHGRFLPF